jgi:hypothetical protein
MKRLSFVFAALVVAAPALADPIRVPAADAQNLPTIDAIIADDASYGGGTNRAVSFCYDNWTNPASLLTGLFASGTDEIADDLTTVGPAGVGLLSNTGINAANANGAAGSALTGGQIAVRYYRLDNGTFISGFNANLPAVNLAPGGSVRLQFADGQLEAFNILIPTVGVFMSTQWNSVTGTGGFTIANAGFQTRGPINVGSSTDNMINVTTATNFNFGGQPVANGGLHIRTNDIPEPASFALLGLGALALLRRRS